MPLDEQTLDLIATRGVSEIIVRDEFIERLQGGKPMRLKMGFDPSRPDIHLGHVVGLRKLRQLQDLGHHVILIVGDWTAQIGDPSGQSATRPMLTHDEVVANAESYMRQFFKVIDKDKTEAVWQSEWFGKFTLADVLGLTSRFTVAQFLDRADFANRFQAHRPIAVTELLYPLLQAYDSVVIESDVEFGGTDQKFNLLVGRELQEMMGQTPQQCFMMPILVGTDGVQKMSKSLGNYIAVEDPPNEMYGKVMSLPDQVVIEYFTLLTDIPMPEIKDMEQAMGAGSLNPIEPKKRLAEEITAQFHSPAEASEARDHFERVIQQRQAPEQMESYSVKGLDQSGASFSIADVLVEASVATSKGEVRRLISQGAVQVDGEKVASDSVRLRPGSVLKIGRRRYLKIESQE